MKNLFTTLISAFLLACLSFINPSYLFGQLTYPTRYPTAVIPHNADGHRLFFLYMPMEYQDNEGQDTFKLYYVIRIPYNYKYYLARSIDYGITWTDTQRVSAFTDDVIIFNPDSSKHYQAFGSWVGQTAFMNKAESTDGGFNFTNPATVMELGEDKSFYGMRKNTNIGVM